MLNTSQKLSKLHCKLICYLAKCQESIVSLDLARIADALAEPEKNIKDALNTLEEAGIVAGYNSIIHPNFLAKASKEAPPIRAFVELSVQPQKSTGYDTIAKRVYKYPQVIEHYLLSGAYEFLVIVEANSHLEIASFVSDKLATIEQVTKTVTHFTFKCYKRQGVPLETEESSDRLAIMA